MIDSTNLYWTGHQAVKKLLFVTFCLIVAFCSVAKAETTLAEKKFDAPAAGEAVAHVRLSTPGYNWAAGPWDPALEVRLDGNFVSSLIPFRGEEDAEYAFMLGNIEAGAHTVSLVDPAATARNVKIGAVETEVIASDDPRYVAISHTPFLYGRPENTNSDVPLLFWYVDTPKAGGGRMIDYSIVWTNEDGGTPAVMLMSKYGRSVDIESVYTMTIDNSGKIVSEVIQGADHVVRQFAGRRIGSHPVLRTCTTNNMVDDSGESPLMFTYLPVPFDTDGTRERMLDRQPWIYRVTYEELKKEKKFAKIIPDLSMNRIDDLRNYALVDLDTDSFGALIGVSLKLRGKNKWYDADEGIEKLRLNRPGVARVAVRLPVGTAPGDIEALKLAASGRKNDRVTIKSVGPVTVLDKDFKPTQIAVDWKKKRALTVGGEPLLIELRN